MGISRAEERARGQGGWAGLDASGEPHLGGCDTTRWRQLAAGTGTGQLTTVDVPRTHARYLRVTSTASAASWWSIAAVRLYT